MTNTSRFPATRAVVDFATGFDLDTVKGETVERAKLLLLDLVGVSVAATDGHLPHLPDLVDLVRGGGDAHARAGEATVLRAGRVATAADAAMVNGLLAHLLEWDDATLRPVGHPSATIVPAVLAVAEARGSGGRAVLEAYLVGLEVHARLGLAQRGAWSHLDPWVPIGHIGLISATAAAGRLLGLSPDQAAGALGMAAHFACQLNVNNGSAAKPFGAGHSARCAVLAAQLAAVGLTGGPDLLEADGGFADTFFGRDRHDLESALGGLGTGPLHLEEVGVAIKRYPACYGTHWGADALRGLLREHRLGEADVESVELVYPVAAAFLDNPAPRTPDQARFSHQYVLAACLLDEQAGPALFTSEAVRSRRVARALAKVSARPHPEHTEPPASWAYDVTVRTSDGQCHHAAVPRPHGHPRDPLHPSEVLAKFQTATAVLGEERSSRVASLVLGLDDVSDVRTLLAELA